MDKKVLMLRTEEIVVPPNRSRTDLGDIDSLAYSIMRHGLLHPIVVRKEEEGYVLVAGERRLRAFQKLEMDEIPATDLGAVPADHKRLIEIEENFHRKDFAWHEEVVAIREMTVLSQRLYGKTAKGYGGGWGLRQTAEALGMAIGKVSQDIRLAEALEEFPELANCPNKKLAHLQFQRLQNAAMNPRTKVEKKLLDVFVADKELLPLSHLCIINLSDIEDETLWKPILGLGASSLNDVGTLVVFDNMVATREYPDIDMTKQSKYIMWQFDGDFIPGVVFFKYREPVLPSVVSGTKVESMRKIIEAATEENEWILDIQCLNEVLSVAALSMSRMFRAYCPNDEVRVTLKKKIVKELVEQPDEGV